MLRRFTTTLLAASFLAAPAAANAERGPVALRAAAERQTGERALREARSTLAGDRVKSPLHVTALLKQVAVALPALRGRERTEAQRILARPTSGDAQPGENAYSVAEQPPHCTQHFCTDSNHNGVPDYVEEMSQVVEHVYQVENGQMHWRTPVSDGTRGDELGKTDVYVADIGDDGIYGYSSPDPGQDSNSQAGYLVLDNDYAQSQYPRYSDPLPPMEVTAAHEYNHVLQFGYDVLEDTWMLESTAVWMEDKVYTDVNDYVSYLDPWAAMTQVPMTRFDALDSSDARNIKVYGDAVWNRWLDVHYGQDTIRRAWEKSATVAPASFAPAAYQAALAGHGTTFFNAFARFAADTAEWGSSGSPFLEGSTWPGVHRLSGHTLSPSASGISGHLDHTAYVLVNVTPTGDRRIKLVAALPRGVSGAFALVASRGAGGSGGVVVRIQKRPHGGRATVTLNRPGSYSRITAVLVNADASEDGYDANAADWRFTKDRSVVTAFDSNAFTQPSVRRRSPRPGRRGVPRKASIVVSFSEPVGEVSARTVKLLGPGGHAVAIRVRYDRSRHRLRVIPRRPLRRHAHYVVELGGQIVDAADNAVPAHQRVWAFRT